MARRMTRVMLAQHKLEEAVKGARENKDSTGLMMAIQSALEHGMDDDCDVYYEAGMLLEELESDFDADAAHHDSVGDDHEPLNDEDIDAWLFGEDDKNDEELYNFDDL